MRGITEERLIKLMKSHLDEETIEALIERECKELSQWQPTSTVPKPGKRVLLRYSGMMCTGIYHNNFCLFVADSFVDRDYYFLLKKQPTHWQELPQEPK